MPPIKTFGERIADALVEDGLLTPKQVEELLEQQKKEGTRLLKLLTDKSYISEVDMVVSMGRVLGTPPVNLARIGIPSDLAGLLPREVATNHKVIPVSRLENRLYLAIKDPASDIHLEPFEKIVRLRYRIDGVLLDATPPPKNLQVALMSRLKIMSNLNIAERRLPQDGRMRMRVGNKDIDLRVSFLPTVHGEKCVLRVLDKSNLSASIEKLGMDEATFKRFKTAVDAPHGLLLVTGPTGSGKTTTLYSALNELNNPDYNIVTVEDPVEFQIPGINQVPVNKEIGLTFANSLRSILRQDPDICMIGEIRDSETAEIAVEAALTGHQVLSTMHCN